MYILDEKRTHIYLIYIFKFSTFLKTVYIYKSSLKTYINHLQYINYFTTHNLQYLLTYLRYITYNELLTMKSYNNYTIYNGNINRILHYRTDISSIKLVNLNMFKEVSGRTCKSDRMLIKYLYCSISRETYLLRSFIIHLIL